MADTDDGKENVAPSHSEWAEDVRAIGPVMEEPIATSSTPEAQNAPALSAAELGTPDRQTEPCFTTGAMSPVPLAQTDMTCRPVFESGVDVYPLLLSCGGRTRKTSGALRTRGARSKEEAHA